MDAAEFHRVYSLWPEIKKAELIDGIVHVPEIGRIPIASAKFWLVGTLGIGSRTIPGIHAGSRCSLVLGGVDEPQPDVVLFWDTEHGGTTRVDEDGWLTSAPDLVAEVSNSSKSYDLHGKKDLYARIGVREYICWQVEDGRIDWWQLVDGEYVSLKHDRSGVIRSVVFPGLSLDTRALLKRVPASKLPRRPRAKR